MVGGSTGLLGGKQFPLWECIWEWRYGLTQDNVLPCSLAQGQGHGLRTAKRGFGFLLCFTINPNVLCGHTTTFLGETANGKPWWDPPTEEQNRSMPHGWIFKFGVLKLSCVSEIKHGIAVPYDRQIAQTQTVERQGNDRSWQQKRGDSLLFYQHFLRSIGSELPTLGMREQGTAISFLSLPISTDQLQWVTQRARPPVQTWTAYTEAHIPKSFRCISTRASTPKNQSGRPSLQKISRYHPQLPSILIIECWKASALGETGSSFLCGFSFVCFVCFWFCWGFLKAFFNLIFIF